MVAETAGEGGILLAHGVGHLGDGEVFPRFEQATTGVECRHAVLVAKIKLAAF